MRQHMRSSVHQRRRLEIETHIDGGTPNCLGRVVAENGQMLKFKTHCFEEH
jgi:hypothetical protein